MMTDQREAADRVQVAHWHPAPAIRVSVAVHAVGALILAIRPELWLWVVTVLTANQLLLIGAVFFPRSALLGANLTRLPAAVANRGEVALTFDDGPDPEVTPQILDLLDRFRMKASFFCVGEKAAAFPEIVNEIARRGHSVENHSYRHSYAFAFYGLSRLGRELDAAQSIMRENAGRPPRFFRAPMGFRSPLLDPVLAQRGLRYVSWTRRGYDTVYTDPRATLDKLTRGLAAGDILLLHDGSSARTPAGQAMVLAVLPPLLDKLEREGLKSVALPDCFSTAQVKAAESALDASALS